MAINWRDHIHSDPALLLGRLVNGWAEADTFEGYSPITQEDLQAGFACVYELQEGVCYFPLPIRH